ncbi:MAG: ArsR/SmtB family transcription factor [Desulfohalobiaceae bacterium]
MNRKIRERYETRSRIMKALGHPSRLFIVEELSRGSRCVCELTEMIGADTSTVSKHLSILREAGLVDYDKQGTQMHYHLSAPCILDFFSCLENLIQTDLERRKLQLE